MEIDSPDEEGAKMQLNMCRNGQQLNHETGSLLVRLLNKQHELEQAAFQEKLDKIQQPKVIN